MIDEVVERVVYLFRKRSQRGIQKYGVTLESNELTNIEWLQHLQEELMDAALYVEKIKSIINEQEGREINHRD